MEFFLGFVVGLSVFWFWGVVSFLVLVVLWALSGEKESWFPASVALFLVAVGLYVRFDPDLETIGIAFAFWLVVGIVYSFWRWFWQVKKLRQRVGEAFKRTDGDSGSRLRSPDLDGCELRQVREGTTVESFKPEFNQYRGRVSLWTTLWPIFLLKDVTVDLIEMIQDFLKSLYQRIADSAFSPESKPNPQSKL